MSSAVSSKPVAEGARPSVAERRAAGKGAREHAPRSSHAGWSAPAKREDAVAVLERQADTRVPELVPIRYGRMSTTPFAFFRGAAAVMAADLALTPVSGLHVQLCGDAHISNFGGFASPERELVFDINDFDETLPGPWEWDLKRLAASLWIASAANGCEESQSRETVRLAVQAYRDAMNEFSQLSNLEVWYSTITAPKILELQRELGRKGNARRLERSLEKARAKDSQRALAKLTETVDGQLRFVSDPPLVVPLAELYPEQIANEFSERMAELLASYLESLNDDRRRLLDGYEFAGLARKVVGVGSVGTRAWVILMMGRDQSDPLMLQAKEAQASVLEEHLEPSRYSNHGQRVVEGQRLMQASSDICLGWLPALGVDGESRDFYVRQLWDGKLSADIDTMSRQTLSTYGRLCAWTLARAHARSGDRIALAGYIGSGDTLDRAIAQFACDYSAQNERDHRALLDAIASGRLQSVDE